MNRWIFGISSRSIRTGLATSLASVALLFGSAAGAATVSSRATAPYLDRAAPSFAGTVGLNNALVDPFGVVFNAATGAGVGGATVVLFSVDNNAPARVFCDDGISTCPNTLVTPSAPTLNPLLGLVPAGGFRFPQVAPGQYRLIVTPPAGFGAPSVAPGPFPNDAASGLPFTINIGSRGEQFTVPVGPAINLDYPVDPAGFLLNKTVSQQIAGIGDFLQYRLTLQNLNPVAATNTVITDRIPPGFRYQAGSLRINGVKQADPAIGADGRTLRFPVGGVAVSQTAQITYVLLISAGAHTGQAVNTAAALADGPTVSNNAQVAVDVRDILMQNHFTIIGEVACHGGAPAPAPAASCPAGAPAAPAAATTYTVRAQFDSGKANLTGDKQRELDALVAKLKGRDIERIELIGHTDSQRVGNPETLKNFHDNYGLSKARAQTVGDYLASALGLGAAQVSAGGKGPDEPVADNKTAAGMAKNRRTEVRVYERAPVAQAAAVACPAETKAPPTDDSHGRKGLANVRVLMDDGTYVISDKDGLFHFEGVREGTHVVQVDLDSLPPGYRVMPRIQNTRFAGRSYSQFVDVKGGGLWRTDFEACPALAAPPPPPADTCEEPPIAPVAPPEAYTVRAQFNSGKANLKGDNPRELDALVARLKGKDIARIELVGHTDSQRVGNPETLKNFQDNYGLSKARAQTVGDYLASALGLDAAQVSASGKGPDEPVASNKTAAGKAKNRRTEVRVYERQKAAPGTATCPVAETAAPAPVAADAGRDADLAYQATQKERHAVLDEQTASGMNTDFLTGQAPGVEWLFPNDTYVPRAPATRIVIKHKPSQSVTLKYIPGEAVSGLSFDGTKVSADNLVAVSTWRGVPIVEGTNRFEAQVLEGGRVVQTLTKVVHYANTPAHAVLVPEESALIADGIHKPVVAVRIFDSTGAPVRAGATGTFTVNPPYVPAELFEKQQQRQLSGLDRFQPTWRIEGDDGVAYIELGPTGDAGTVVLNFGFQPTIQTTRKQELRVWLESRPRDWVVVGFAEGTVGYNTLKGNQQAFAEDGGEQKTWSDGKTSLYAKGRVLGKWLLTLAYDSDKPEERRRRQGLLSTIDPQRFYTLYGDGAEQRYDAASQDKLYVKLERDQFYALFGDYDTGLTVAQLTRYSRTLQGIKSEYGGNGPLQVTAFAADTPLHYAHDEIQGNGSSGLYHLRTGGIVLNSEHLHLETRDRLHSERILDSKALLRHLDYDIDYDAGTIFFHEPVFSRDTAFNPIFIVAEYETFGRADSELNAGGRIGATVPLLGGTLIAGVTGVHEDSTVSSGDLGGVDARLKLADDTEVRVEGAASHGQAGTVDQKGGAGLVEVEHHGASFDVLGYARRQEPQFGLNQQSLSERGMQKIGADGRYSLTDHVSLVGQAYQQQNLASDVTRNAGTGQVEYRTEQGTARLGALYARDEAGSGALAGRAFESQQLTASGNRFFFDRALELSAQADSSIGNKNDSVDFPSRYQFGAAYAITDDVKLIAAEEYTSGLAFNSLMTRVGLQAVPWKGARLTSTLNQMDMGEYGPRSFGLFGLTQALLIDKNWGVDFGMDTSRAFNEGGTSGPVINTAQPIASGGNLGSGLLTEDFVALTGGLTYRSELWSWNGRAESRDGETSDRYGFTTAFLRQAQAGVAFSLNAQGFRVNQNTGTRGLYGTAGMGWAWRPLASQYSILDKLEFRYDELNNGTGTPGSGLFGNTSLAVSGDALSRRLINNFSLNRVSREWTAEDRQGNLFQLSQRQQWSLYYGAKYAFDRFDGENYHGYTDLTGLEWRWDLNTWVDFGVQASALHSWDAHNWRYSYGPQVGVSPVTNGWVSLGWNFQGFRDRDFDAARYSAQGPYLTLRFKFDQNTRFGSSATSARAIDPPAHGVLP